MRGNGMDKKMIGIAFLVIAVAIPNLAMSRRGQYDEEARQQEKAQKQMEKEAKSAEKREPMKTFATGLKEVTVDNAKDALSETAESTASEPPVAGTMDGVRKGGEKVIDNTVKGAVKIATFGYAKGDNYQTEEPKKGSGEPGKIKFTF